MRRRAAMLVAGAIVLTASRTFGGCLINTIGTQIFIGCEPAETVAWRGGVDDGQGTRWRSSGSPRPHPEIRRFEEVGSQMVEMEPNTTLRMLKVR